MTVPVPARVREVSCLGGTVHLRRPDRPEMGPVVDAQMAQQEALQGDTRQALESGVDENLVAACIHVCAVAGADDVEPIYTPSEAFEVAVEASVEERTDMAGTEIASTAMTLCRASLTLATVVGKAFMSGSLTAARSRLGQPTSRSASAAE